MANNTELDNRLKIVETIIANAVVIPKYLIAVDDAGAAINDYAFSEQAGINGGSFAIVKIDSLPVVDDTDVTLKIAT